MFHWFVTTLQHHPELAIFLTLAIGYWIGNLKIGNFSLGSVTGVLLAGVLVGQMDITISENVKSVFFLLFLFAVGYGVGPQFVRGIATNGAPQALFAVVICFICLAAAYIAIKVAGYDVGFGAGLFAGSQTISASIGLATDAINRLGLPADKAKEMLNQIPVAYAVCYIWGTIGTGWILSKIGPKLLRIDLVAECKKYEAEMSSGEPETGMGSVWHAITMRAYQIAADGKTVGMTVAEAETFIPDTRLFIERIRRDGKIIEFEPKTILKAGDVLAISGHHEVLVETIEKAATEVEDRELLSVPVESIDLVVTKKAIDGKTLMEISKMDFARGVYLNKITRGAAGVDIPILAKTQVHRGDILKITGTSLHIDRLTKAVGYADRPTAITDMLFVGLGIVLGGLFGSLVLPIKGVPITLSSCGGTLIAGLIIGWLRSIHPTFGRIPAPSLWFMNSVGLNIFIAVVGISSGPGFITGLKAAGISLFFWGMFATSVPMLLAPLIGKYVFKFHPAINLGICGGARTSTASVGMVNETAKSNIPMLGYTIPYAVSNTLLTLWGMVIVLLLK